MAIKIRIEMTSNAALHRAHLAGFAGLRVEHLTRRTIAVECRSEAEADLVCAECEARDDVVSYEDPRQVRPLPPIIDWDSLPD